LAENQRTRSNERHEITPAFDGLPERNPAMSPRFDLIWFVCHCWFVLHHHDKDYTGLRLLSVLSVRFLEMVEEN
jgi:hypothetical protein